MVDDPKLAADGEALFVTYGCATCHFGPALGGQRTERIAGADKQVPSLRRISLHPPYMHDGRAPTLRWILVHMIEEYARHNGHADLLRESVDGETGE